MIQIGDKAPDFTLYDSNKKKVTLSAERDHNVLLLFFPLAFTSTCTAELCSVRDNIGQFNNLKAKVFGISVDSIYTLARYKADQQLNFSLLSDFNKVVSKAYDTIYQKFGFDMEGVSKRSAFLIDTEGIVQYVEVLENASQQPNFTAVNEKLRIIMA